jgi:osmotically-inducible protein OsmY
VYTSAGVVTVAGSVPDENSLRRALDLASGIKGVREIRNGMVVEFPK